MALPARALVEFYRGEFQCAGGGKAAARGLKNFNRLWLECGRGLGGWAGLGRDRLGLSSHQRLLFRIVMARDN